MSDLFVERMAKSKAQEEDGSSENGPLDTGEFEKPELLSSRIQDGDEKIPPFLGKQKGSVADRCKCLLRIRFTFNVRGHWDEFAVAILFPAR